MKNMSQERILKKLLKKKKLYLYQIENLIICYFENKYDLNELFKLVNNFGISLAIVKQIDVLVNYYEICDIKKIVVFPYKEKKKEIIIKILKAIKKEECISELALFFEIYDEDILKLLSLNTLIKMYKEDSNEKIFNFLLNNVSVNDIMIVFNALRNYLSEGQKHDFLDKIFEFKKEIGLEALKRNLESEEFEYIRKKTFKSAIYADDICQFVYSDLLGKEKRKECIDEIISRNCEECSYLLLLKAELTQEETKKLKEILKNGESLYYLFYLAKTNIKFLLNVFGSYTAILIYMEGNRNGEYLKYIEDVLLEIENKANLELEMGIKKYEDAIKNPVYIVKPKKINKNRTIRINE